MDESLGPGSSLSRDEEVTRMRSEYIESLVDLIEPRENVFLNMSSEEAQAALRSGDPQRVAAIRG
ncbi:MAG: hypothetical protein KDB14_11155, partial [Planctomycetales bacterium]|nr:hypothetical protein [Planctomycetales bacterium]